MEPRQQRRSVLGTALCGVLWLLAAGTAEGADLARLVAPAEGAVLEAGQLAWLEWQAGADLRAAAEVEEWEAFLSLDGGRTYPIRLTPHLDLACSRVRFRVPEIPSLDGRIVLRMGNEREERTLPQSTAVRIVPASRPSALRRRTVALEGPAPWEAEEGVVLWVAGARDGSGWVEVEPLAAPPGLEPVLAATLPSLTPFVTPQPADPPSKSVVFAQSTRVLVAAAPRPQPGPARPSGPSLLRLQQRRNE